MISRSRQRHLHSSLSRDIRSIIQSTGPSVRGKKTIQVDDGEPRCKFRMRSTIYLENSGSQERERGKNLIEEGGLQCPSECAKVTSNKEARRQNRQRL